MIRTILQMNDPIITTPCERVKDYGTKELKGLIRDLLDTCQEKIEVTAGLSAPQIGVSLRVCVCRRMDIEEKEPKQPLSAGQLWEVMINPVILSTSKKTSIFWEGCLSVGEGPNGLYGPVERPNSIKIEYINIKGEIKQLKCVGFFSHIVQHEIDHLDGNIFLKYIDDPTNIWLSKDLDEYYDEHKEYPPI